MNIPCGANLELPLLDGHTGGVNPLLAEGVATIWMANGR